MQRLEDPTQGAIGEVLQGERALRTETLYVHTFSSAEACARFHERAHAGSDGERIHELVQIGYARGTDALGAAMNALADEPDRRDGAGKRAFAKRTDRGQPRGNRAAGKRDSSPHTTV